MTDGGKNVGLAPEQILAVARRDGVDLSDPKQRTDFMRRLLAHVDAQAAARVRTDPDGLQHWQRAAIGKFVGNLLWLLHERLAEPPKFALLVTLYGDGADAGQIAGDDAVAVEITYANSATHLVCATTIVDAAGGLPQIARVETVGPSLGYMLWVGSFPNETLLFAWDFRGIAASVSGEQLDNLLARLRGVGKHHPKQSPGWYARLDRERALSEMDRDERRSLIRQAYEDEMVDPSTRRIPLRGLLQRNRRAVWDAGGSGSAYGLLQKVSALCRAHTQQESGEVHEAYATGSNAQPRDEVPPEDHVALVEEYTAVLSGRERESVRHYLYAKLIDCDLKEYCAQRGLPYAAIRKAAARGLQRLRDERGGSPVR